MSGGGKEYFIYMLGPLHDLTWPYHVTDVKVGTFGQNGSVCISFILCTGRTNIYNIRGSFDSILD